jgi:hypothetical protein
MCAMALLISASAFGQWMRLAFAPVPVAEWHVSPPLVSVPPAAAPSPTLAVPGREPEPTTPVPNTATAEKPLTTAAASAAKPSVPPATTAHPPARVAAADASPAASGANEVSTIWSVLDRYRVAFSSLNPGSVRAVWPAADLRALARDFADIKRQTFAFDNCRIDVQGQQAEADCAGRVSLVTKSGSQEPSIQSRHWVFTLVHETDAWRIRSVISQAPRPD